MSFNYLPHVCTQTSTASKSYLLLLHVLVSKALQQVSEYCDDRNNVIFQDGRFIHSELDFSQLRGNFYYEDKMKTKSWYCKDHGNRLIEVVVLI